MATKLTDNERAVLSLFFATVSTALANIAFIDEIYDRKAESASEDAAETAALEEAETAQSI